MIKRAIGILVFFLVGATGGGSVAGERVDLLPAESGWISEEHAVDILHASAVTLDPWGEFDPSLGAAAALNRALALRFTGYASPAQVELQRRLARTENPQRVLWAPFARDVLHELNKQMNDLFPEPVELLPFDLAPSQQPTPVPGNPHLLSLRYNEEEYLERLLQRLYFKLIQGPVLLTVPYQGDADSIPEEYRNWNNFRYGADPTPMTWDEERLVYVDWALTHTVVLHYEDGKIACFDGGKKYYIDHTAAIVAAGAMLAHPQLEEIARDGQVHFVLAPVAEEETGH